MTMKLINKLRSITHTLSMGILFKPHQDPTVCPKHGPMAGCTGRANPDIDPDNEWDTIYYCPECLQEEQETENKAPRPTPTAPQTISELANYLNHCIECDTEILETEPDSHAGGATVLQAQIDTCQTILNVCQEAEKKATPPEERTDILYLPEVDGGAEGWYHTTEDGDTEGPYRTRDEALIELGEYRERVRAKLWDSEKSDN